MSDTCAGVANCIDAIFGKGCVGKVDVSLIWIFLMVRIGIVDGK